MLYMQWLYNERSVTFSRALAIVFLKPANQIRTCFLHDNIMEFVTRKTTVIGEFLSSEASFYNMVKDNL